MVEYGALALELKKPSGEGFLKAVPQNNGGGRYAHHGIGQLNQYHAIRLAVVAFIQQHGHGAIGENPGRPCPQTVLA